MTVNIKPKSIRKAMKLLLWIYLTSCLPTGLSLQLGPPKPLPPWFYETLNEEPRSARTPASLQIGILLLASVLSLGGQDARAVSPNAIPGGAAPSVLVAVDPGGVMGLIGQSTKEVFGLIPEEEKQAKLREYDAKFEQDYQNRNQK